MRGLGSGSIVEPEIPVRYATMDNGAQVLVATEDIQELVAKYVPVETARRTSGFSS